MNLPSHAMRVAGAARAALAHPRDLTVNPLEDVSALAAPLLSSVKEFLLRRLPLRRLILLRHCI